MDFGVAVDECQVLSLFLREFHFIFSNRTVELTGFYGAQQSKNPV